MNYPWNLPLKPSKKMEVTLKGKRWDNTYYPQNDVRIENLHADVEKNLF
ncbi:MAG: hypothetical protein CM15mP127_14490 [Gammaproteobacteria bacterium]|nr:MAG: hypothetical protein CM15mP127_14490 [Gammaproteobacteria bacterium]